jgi:uncharacterized protein (TIGR03000 family)
MFSTFRIGLMAAVAALLLPLGGERASAQMYYGRIRTYYNPAPGYAYSSVPYYTGTYPFNGYPPTTYTWYAQGSLPTYMTSINYPNIYGAYGYQFAPGRYTYGVSPSAYSTAPTTYGYYVTDEATQPTFRAAPDTAARPLRTVDVPEGTTASIDVRVPADAELRFDGTRTSQTGSLRRFVTPPLSPDTNYRYDVTASWSEGGQQVTRSRRVPVRAGEQITVDFTTPETPTQEGTSTLKTRPSTNR